MEAPQGHWVNNFWGPDDAGYRQLMKRVHCAKQTCDELRGFYKERVAIEQEYAKRLNSLARKALGSTETGGLKQSLETVRATTQATAASHETVARQLAEQLIAPLDSFSGSMRGRTKTIEDTMGQLTRAKSSQNHSSEKARTRYVAECNKISGFQAQQNLLTGRELDKNNQKLDRATYQVEGFQRQYQDSLRALAQTMENWNAEWRLSCDRIEQIEDERLTFLKSNLWAYANAISASCVADDEGCETVRLALERTDPAKDLVAFSREFGTGSRIQDPPEFVNFLQGFSRENDDDDGHYHVANFGSAMTDNENEVLDLGLPSPSASLNTSASTAPHRHAATSHSAASLKSFAAMDTVFGSGAGALGGDALAHEHVKAANAAALGAAGAGAAGAAAGHLAQVSHRPSQAQLQHQLSQQNQQQPQNQQQQNQQNQQQPQSSSSSSSNIYAPKLEPRKRRSWAMPFKRKSSPEQPLNYVSALDQPPAGKLQPVLTPQESASFQLDSRRKSWAPDSAAAASHAAPASAAAAGGGIQQDPLLSALERLKTPNLKPRPKSMGFAPSGGGGPPSPYGNGSPTRFAAPASPEEVRKKPVHRKQVGSQDGPTALPTQTSDGRRVIRHSRAQYDYRAAIPEELTFRKGDLLLVAEMQEDGWWDCELAGRGVFGLAPSNFLVDAR